MRAGESSDVEILEPRAPAVRAARLPAQGNGMHAVFESRERLHGNTLSGILVRCTRLAGGSSRDSNFVQIMNFSKLV